MFLSIIAPAFNEEKNIMNFIKELERVIDRCQLIKKYEIIIVDDHSTDDAFRAVSKISRGNIKIFRLSRRSGSHVALRVGLSVAHGDAALCLAADGQDDPVVLPMMVGKLLKGKNVIWAVRKNRNEPVFQKLFSQVFYLLLSFFTKNLNSNIDLANADFYLIDRQVVDAINACSERNTSLFGLIIWLGFEQDFVSYDRRARLTGKSKWNYHGRLRLAADWIIAFSGVPLRIISLLGIIFSAVGALYAVFVVIYVLSGYAKPGWAEPVFLILITSGVQMTMLGVVGEYLWRNLDEARKRPLFFIEKNN